MQIFGLVYSEAKPVPLQNVKVEANVVDMIAEVTIQQTYKNVEKKSIEAVYKFPIYEAAAICGFEAEIDEQRKVKGIVKEAKEAAKEYDESIQRGHGAYLLEEQLADVFQCTIGNIAPDQTVVIKITYVTELKQDADAEQIRFVLPTTIAPRYDPSSLPTVRSNDEKKLIPNLVSYSSSTGYHIDLNVTCRMTSSIQTIESPSHHISTEVNIDGDPKVSKITLAEEITYLEKDFILVVKSQDLDAPRAFVEYNSVTETNCVMLTLVPKFALNETMMELVFVMDRSGSMEGEPIQKAAQTLQLLIRSLPESCYFNVVSFGSRHNSLFPQSQLYSETTHAQALEHAKIMKADYGGTEIYGPLKWVFDNARSDMPTSVFLITDGQVWNVETLVDLIRTNVEQKEDKLRLFSIGIGDSVSHNLVDSVARAGKGYAQYVTINERMDKKIVGMLKNVIKPPIKDYNIIWTKSGFEDAETEKINETRSEVNNFDNNLIDSPQDSVNFVEDKIKQAPFVIPPIYSGVRLIVYCILAKGVDPNNEVTLTAQSPDGPVKLSIPLDPVTLQGSKIHTLAARKLIQDLDEGISFIHKHPTNKGKLIPNSVIQEQVVYLGKTFNLASKYTSFLAIDERDNESFCRLYQPEIRVVPAQLPGSARYTSGKSSRAYAPLLASARSAVYATKSLSREKRASVKSGVQRQMVALSLQSRSSAAVRSSVKTSRMSPIASKIEVETADAPSLKISKMNFKESKIEVLYKFLGLQSFNGEFNPTSQFYSCFNKEEFKDFKEIGIDNEKVLCTALAIGYLEVVMFGQFKDECGMCWEKANKALKKLVDDDKVVSDVLRKARGWISEWLKT